MPKTEADGEPRVCPCSDYQGRGSQLVFGIIVFSRYHLSEDAHARIRAERSACPR